MKTMVAGWVDVSVALELEKTAELKRVTKSAIVEWALRHFLAEHATEPIVVVSSPGGNRSDRDGMDGAARDIVRAHLGYTIVAIQGVLKAAGIKRSTGWISNARIAIKGC